MSNRDQLMLDDLSEDQAERRDRLLNAVLELAGEGGYDAVQLREVSRLTDVSSRTIYKYFGSRENLIVEAMVRWRDQVSRRSVAKGRTIEDRVLSLYRHNYNAFKARPMLFETFMRMQRELGTGSLDWGRQIVYQAIDDELSKLDEKFATDFRVIVDSVIHTAFHSCAHGLITFDEVWRRTEMAVRRLEPSSARRR